MGKYIKPPSKDNYEKIAKEFEEKWNLPNCIGVVGGKYVAIRCTPNSGSTNFNYKKQFSVTIFAVCDANYCFTIAEVSYAGIMSDAGIFKTSPFGQKYLK